MTLRGLQTLTLFAFACTTIRRLLCDSCEATVRRRVLAEQFAIVAQSTCTFNLLQCVG
jgi:hypothetical protein